MRNLLILAACLQGLTPTVQAHAGCAIIPDQLLEMLRDNEDFDLAARQRANATLQLANTHRQQRTAADVTGITTDDDDNEIPIEQNPVDQVFIDLEEQSLEAADDLQIPDPNSIESRRRRQLRDRVEARQSGPNRWVYNKNQNCANGVPGRLVRSEASESATDDGINQVFEGLGAVFNLYSNVFGRDSIDGKGGKLHGQVHFCRSYNNAIWDGVQMLFGDGDDYFFNKGSFVKAIDVVGHEVTHGIVQIANPLFYDGSTGALNEHIADVFGILTKHYYNGQDVKSGSWLIGEGLLTSRIGGPSGAIRSMAQPGSAYPSDRQPSTMDNFYTGLDDHHGVHFNSGIPNHAFYLFAQDIGGVAWEIPGKIWYSVLTQGQGKFGYTTETFEIFAMKTIGAANQLYNETVGDTLYAAWQKVGVLK